MLCSGSMLGTLQGGTTRKNHGNCVKNQFNIMNNKHKTRLTNKLNGLLVKYKTSAFINQKYEEWFLNLTTTDIPVDIKCFLGLGEQTGIPYKLKGAPIIKAIVDIENIINESTDIDKRNKVRARSVNVLSNYIKQLQHKPDNSEILKLYNRSKNFLKINDDIIIIKSDKTKRTVALTHEQYNSKAQELLNDDETYSTTDLDMIKKTRNRNNLIIKKLEEAGHIDKPTAKKLTTDSTIAPRFYGLLKDHKPGMPLRPIISGIGSPIANTSKFVAELLCGLQNEKYYVENSVAFIEKVKTCIVPANHKLVSYDVKSLYTNVPLELLIAAINQKWDAICTRTSIPQDKFIELIQFCYHSGFFKYKNQTYLQKQGMAMGSPLSSPAACLVMDALLDHIIPQLGYQPSFFIKYVDDLVTCVPEDQIDNTLKLLNGYHPKLQFTMEVETNSMINYLDVTLIHCNDGSIQHKWYRKECSTERCLNYLSFHPRSQIINVAKNMIQKARKLTTNNHMNSTMSEVKRILRCNQFPIGIINKLINNTSAQPPSRKEDAEPKRYFSIPFMGGCSYQLKRICEACIPCRITCKQYKKINNLFSKTKDKINNLSKCNTVYQIPCECEASYIGQSKRPLGTRIHEHSSGRSRSALTDHQTETGHGFKFDEVTILHQEPNLNKRLTLEIIEI